MAGDQVEPDLLAGRAHPPANLQQPQAQRVKLEVGGLRPGDPPTGSARASATADALPEGLYFRSPDGRIGTAAQQPWQTGGMKVLWLKPVGSHLMVSGQRLDGEAPPLRAQLPGPSAYRGDYEASDVVFPAAGCWEVEARADGSILRFVVLVR